MQKAPTPWISALDAPFSGTYQEAKALFGGKGAGLREMVALALPVPPAFTVTTELCNAFYQSDKTLPPEFDNALKAALHHLETTMGLRLGDPERPLLLSVRSGARASMPGMMDTVLNLGLNQKTTEALARQTKDERFAYDSYRRFIQMYSNVVLRMDLAPFEAILSQYKMVRGVTEDSALTAEDLKAIVERYLETVLKITGKAFPEDVGTQLKNSIVAVLKSWMNPRATTYRTLYNIPASWGTAVTVQAMVFGNLGMNSGTGVAFTRNPATGEKALYGEYLLNAQGEDVVAGIRTPAPISGESPHTLEQTLPNLYTQLKALTERLENHYQDMQDVEFTIQEGKLWVLQTRHGKRTATAALKIATDLVSEKLVDIPTALKRVEAPALEQLLYPQLKHTKGLTLLGEGLPASPGAAIGRIAFSAKNALTMRAEGQRVILVRDETSPEDIEGMAAAEGILTACGGMTSHAAVVARGMGKPCIVGVSNLYINATAGTVSLGGTQLKAGDFMTLNGGTGEIYQGEGKVQTPEFSATFDHFMTWADETRRLAVRANADTPHDAEKALRMGAEGVGLCRTEHMFFESERILAVRQMILAPSRSVRTKALRKILPMQQGDFEALFRVLQGRPLGVRLLDPPLHEFLPKAEGEIQSLAHSLRMDVTAVKSRIADLREENPMLGNRGCRLGITIPEIYQTQVQAIMKAALAVQKEGPVSLEIIVPLVSLAGEFRALKALIQETAEDVFTALGKRLDYQIGTMIELPRAALKADKIAYHADFLCFGTNDLTQTTFGFSRDDVGSFLPVYRKKGLLERDPFVSLDQSGVGELIQLAVTKARSVKPHIKMGVCGEQGADPASIHFFEKLCLDYVSCSPYRVPIARLSAAHATIDQGPTAQHPASQAL